MGKWNSSVTIVTTLRDERPKNLGAIFLNSNRYFSLQTAELRGSPSPTLWTFHATAFLEFIIPLLLATRLRMHVASIRLTDYLPRFVIIFLIYHRTTSLQSYIQHT